MAIAIADLSGSPYERGLSYGASRRLNIEACIFDWFNSLHEAGISNPNAYLAKMLQDTEFLKSAHRYAPELLDEIRGVADGARQSFELMFAAQLMDEEWTRRDRAERATLPKCSAVALRHENDGTVIGQNMDLEGYTDGHQVVIRIAPDLSQAGVLLFSTDSMIGLFGVNTCHIAVCVNAMPQLPSARTGMPVAFIVRKILQARTIDEAVQVVKTLPHATPQHYLIGDAHRIRSFEASPRSVVEYYSSDPCRVFHTNHPLTQPFGTLCSPNENSLARLSALKLRLAAGGRTLESIKRALSSRDNPEYPVARDKRTTDRTTGVMGISSFTTGSMISHLHPNGKSPDVWVCPGPPSPHSYTAISLTAS